MRKLKFILLIIPILFLSSCNSSSIVDMLIIASIGFEPAEEGYYGYFYLPLSEDIVKSESKEGNKVGQYAKVEGKNIAEIFSNMNISTKLEVNYRHASSIIVNEKLMNDNFLDELISFINHSNLVDYNFFMFCTEDSLEDIYSFKNPNNDTVLNSMILSSSSESGIFLAAQPIYFLEFCRDYYVSACLKFPLISIEELWTIEEKPAKNFHCKKAVYYFNDTLKKVEEEAIYFWKNNENIYITVDDVQVLLSDYKISKDFNNRCEIKVSCEYEVISGKKTLEKELIRQYIEEKMNQHIEKYKDVDPLNLNYYNHVFQQKLSYDDVKYAIELRKY